MKVADYIAKTLAEHGARQVFLVTGGMSMHLIDAIGRHGLDYVCNHHEQACAIAAEGYARVTGNLAVVSVTAGPGGINALNGVFGAWTDSVPMLILSGQVKRETCMATYGLTGLRQMGDQEVDIVRMAGGITKYAVMVSDPNSIKYHLERALTLARQGRPGPCWIDVPIDVQTAQVEPDEMPAYDPAEDAISWNTAHLQEQVRETLTRLHRAERPVILAGTGVRVADAIDVFERVVHKLKIPVAMAWTQDTLPYDDPYFCGKAGTIGDRAGNFTVQNADALLILGSRLNIRQVSYNWDNFARCAYKIQVDVDAAELNKPTVRPDLGIHCDAKVFLEEMERQIDADTASYAAPLPQHESWVAWCRERVQNYPILTGKPESQPGSINPYRFIDTLWDQLDDDEVVVCGDATACIATFQTSRVKKGQRIFSNSGSASTGYDLPASIGAAVARGGKRVVCLAGDGSIQMNVQELQTVAYHQFPIKIFVLNNRGYLSMRLTQASFCERFIGEGPDNGVSFPDMVKIAAAYGLATERIDQPDCAEQIRRVLAAPGPTLCEVQLDPKQAFEPKLSSRQLPSGKMISAPLEDMFPFLERDELMKNLLIPAVGE